MKTEHIEAFVEVIRSGSLTVAATRLGISQPLLTRHIQSFEDELQVPLFDRRSKPLQPTALALRVSEECQQVLAAVERLKDAAAADAPLKGNFRLGVTQGIGEAMRPALIDYIAAPWPDLTLTISTGWSAELLESVQRNELKAAALFMTRDARLPKGLRGKALAHTKLVVVRGAQHPPVRTLVECNRVGWIVNPDGCGFRANLWRQLADQGVAPNLTLDTHATEVQLDAVSKGHGAGLMPQVLLDRSPHRKSLKVQAIKDFAPLISAWVVSRDEPATFQPVIDRMAESLKHTLARR